MSMARLIIVAVLAGGVAYLWKHPPVGSTPDIVGAVERVPGDDVDGVASVAPGEMRPLDYYAVITEKTLFYPDRRPPAAPVKQAPKAEAEPEYVLRGVLMVPGGAMALIGREDGEPPARVRVGDTLGAWTVAAIDPLNVTLNKSGGEALQLPLKRNVGPPPENPRAPVAGSEASALQPGPLPTADSNPDAPPPEPEAQNANGQQPADATNKTQDEANQ